MFIVGLRKQIKCLLLDSSCMFWTFLFPVILCVLFSITIPDTSYQYYEATPVMIVGNLQSDYKLFQAFKVATTTSGESLFQVSLGTDVVAEEKLSNGTIVAYINKEDFYEVHTNSYKSGAILVTTFMDWFDETEAKSVVDFDMQYSMEDCAESDFDKNIVYFFSLLGITALLSIHWGIRLVHDMGKGQSGLASRILLCPVSYPYLVIQNLLACLVIEFVDNSVVLAIFLYARKIELFPFIFYVLPIQFLTSLAGVFGGMLLGVIGSGSYAAKHRKCEIILSLCALLSGTVFYKVRYTVDSVLPLLAMLNPASVATDALYHIYFVKDMSLYFRDVGVLGVMIVLLFNILVIIKRRKQYARI